MSDLSSNGSTRTSALTPSEDYARLETATASLDAPFAAIDLDAFEANAADLLRRADGKPIRLATKSVRCRRLQDEVLARPGFSGCLCFTLSEALWLASAGHTDLVVGYPTTDRVALRELTKLTAARPETRVTLMVDSIEQLDFIDAAVGVRSAALRICIDVDASWPVLGGRVKIGAKRSPVSTKGQAVALAREIVDRDGFELVGLMAYEAQIAGVGDAPPGKPLRALVIGAIQSRSAAELADRRAQIVAAVGEIAPLEFVNGGGTGSIETTVAEPAVTEVAAGSGLFGPGLFSAYRSFNPRPAALFALPVVRRPGPGVVTVLGGGYVASGAADKSRLPIVHLPKGLKLDRQEGAGEVQTPLLGQVADDLAVGDRVWMRHAKAGELCERFERLYLIRGDRVVDDVATYRGDGRSYL